MKNYKIGKKLIITFGCIILMFCIAVLFAVSCLSSNGNKFDNFYKSGYQVTNEVMEVRRAIQSNAKYIGYCMMSPSTADTEKYMESANDEDTNMKDGLTFMREHFSGDSTLVDGFEDSMNQVVDAREQVFEYALAGQNAEASKLYFDQVMPGYLSANDYLTKIYNASVSEAQDNFDQADNAVRIAVIFLLLIALLALIITVVLSLYITKALTRPIKEIEFAAKEIAKGNLDATIRYSSRDELGSLSNEMRSLTSTLKEIITDESNLLDAMAEGNFDIKTQAEEKYVGDFQNILHALGRINSSLSDTLSQINISADQVAVGSEQVSNGAQALSQGSTEQAGAVQQLAATINEISQQIEQNSENCRQANEKVVFVGGEVTESNERMQNMLSAMGEISHTSEEISKIIKTIEDIAFQTNILALNAAVEAARAGAAGKGFAVVADEVRNLATKSQDASKNTTHLIESSIQAVGNGTRIANETAQSLQNVVQGAGEVAVAIQQIADASAEQASAASQVTIGIDQISSVVQTNSATAEESAAASQELLEQSQMLKQLVHSFRLKGKNSSSF